jgi:hypothetical protein
MLGYLHVLLTASLVCAEVQPIEPPPPTGRALQGFGIFGIVLGAANIGGGVAIHAIGLGEATFIGGIELGLGVGIMTLGAIGTYYGTRRRLELRAWEQRTGLDREQWLKKHPEQGPAPGRGLVIGGTLLAGGALAPLGIGVSSTHVMEYGYRWPIASITSGGLLLAGGVAMIVVGAQRVHRHRRARALTWIPSPWLGAHGVGLSIAGQF